MTVHVLPCGTSMLRDPRPPQLNATLDRTDLRDLKALASQQLGTDNRNHPDDRWASRVEARLSGYGPALRGCSELTLLSAETASLHNHRPALAAADPIVLLASDTAAGVLSALLVGLQTGRPVHYHPRAVLDGVDAGTRILGGTGEPVHVIRIEGLLPDSTARFTDAAEQLALAVLWAARIPRPAGVPLVFHLAGGYKATLPYLVPLAEYVKAANWGPVEAWCLHEGDTDLNPHPEPVAVGVRQVDLEADLACLERAGSGVLPDDTRLLGFAYTEVTGSGRAELTPLGRALTAISVYLRGQV